MRICMLSYSFYESDSRILQYVSALQERGDVVDVFALRRKGDARLEVFGGANLYRIQYREVNECGPLSYLFRILRFFLVAFWSIAKQDVLEPYDVVHVHSVPDFLVFAALIPKIRGAKVILDIHDILPEFYASKFGAVSDGLLFQSLTLIEKISAAFADFVIIANEIWYDRLTHRSVNAAKCETIRNYPDSRFFYERPKRPRDGKFILLYPGSLNRHQGLDIAIRAFSKIADRILDAEFHIYGEGPAKGELMGLSKQLGLVNRIWFHEPVAGDRVGDIMANSDLAVVPKRASTTFGNEAASTKIMEFMAVGVPVIVARTQIDTLYHDETMVKFFASGDESDLADAIELLWSDPVLRAALVAAGARYVSENNWNIKKQDYLAILDGLVSSRMRTRQYRLFAHGASRN